MLRIHSEGWRFIVASLVAAPLFGLAWAPLALLALAFAAFCAMFFRNPKRTPPATSDAVVSGADGRIVSVVEAAPPPELGMGEEPMRRVSVFLSLFDVHVNRMPVDGTVVARHYRQGRFFNAALDKASIHNERMALRVALEDGAEIAVIQIAGLIARRIRCDVVKGDRVRMGSEFGIIRFGSRTDHYLPLDWPILVSVGDRVTGGETVIAKRAGHKDLATSADRAGERREDAAAPTESPLP